MGQIANYKYPEIDAQEAVKIADVLVNEFGGEATSEEAFAQELGHKSTQSGAYRSKMADARKWGIVSSRGVEATELAYRLANPRDRAAEEEALFEMYYNVEVLRDLYEQLDGRQPPAEFWRVLEEVTGTNPKEAKDAAPDIRSLYKQMLDYEPEEESDGADGDAEIVDEKREPARPSSNGEGIFVSVGGDTLDLAEANETNIEMARFFLDSKKREISSAASESENQPEEQTQEELPTT